MPTLTPADLHPLIDAMTADNATGTQIAVNRASVTLALHETRLAALQEAVNHLKRSLHDGYAIDTARAHAHDMAEALVNAGKPN